MPVGCSGSSIYVIVVVALVTELGMRVVAVLVRWSGSGSNSTVTVKVPLLWRLDEFWPFFIFLCIQKTYSATVFHRSLLKLNQASSFLINFTKNLFR